MICMEIAHTYLNGNADAVEFCPHEPFLNILAAATYTLQEGDKPSRSGSIYIFNVDRETRKLEQLCCHPTAGVLDIKWNPHLPLLGIASADGCIRVNQLNSPSENTITGSTIKELSVETMTNTLCLCVDWSSSGKSMVSGTSDGCVSLASVSESGLVKTHEWKAHDYEVWGVCFDPHHSDRIYTCSDDSRFICWDTRESPPSKAFQSSKEHKMGVCCAAKSPHDWSKMVTGCYDEKLRVWDVRSVSTPVVEERIDLGGGVWKVKHHPAVSGVVLAACMHNGFAVVRIAGEVGEILETYNNHESLCYGVDWHRSEVGGGNMAATCSFYDRLLRVWTPQFYIRPNEMVS